MEGWNNGMMEKWKDRMMEERKNETIRQWKNGRVEKLVEHVSPLCALPFALRPLPSALFTRQQLNLN
jgi:hypothetical protein